MIVRIADQGEAAVPELLAIVRDATLTPEKGRESVEHAVALGFMLLGPRGRSAIPEIEAMIRTNDTLLYSDRSGVVSWNVALARMGKPIDEITFPGDSSAEPARDREDLRRRVKRFDPQKVWIN